MSNRSRICSGIKLTIKPYIGTIIQFLLNLRSLYRRKVIRYNGFSAAILQILENKMKTFTIEMSEKQKNRIVEALLEYAIAHPEIPDDNFEVFNTDHPLSLAELLREVEDDGVFLLFIFRSD
jgi:hypothetical protein